MNSLIKKQWVEALRSGEYRQSSASLKSLTGFCCLGVLEDCVLSQTGNTWVQESRGFILKTPDDNSRIGNLTLGTQVLAEITSMGEFPIEKRKEINEFLQGKLGTNNPDSYRSLTHLNDRGIQFPIIADFIEKFF